MSDDTESREPIEHSTNRTGRGAMIFVALVGYILSPVPVAWVLGKVGVLERLETAFAIFYAPLILLSERVEFVGKFYDWHGRLLDL